MHEIYICTTRPLHVKEFCKRAGEVLGEGGREREEPSSEVHIKETGQRRARRYSKSSLRLAAPGGEELRALAAAEKRGARGKGRAFAPLGAAEEKRGKGVPGTESALDGLSHSHEFLTDPAPWGRGGYASDRTAAPTNRSPQLVQL